MPDFHAGMMKLMECWIVLDDLHCLVVRRFWRAFLCGFPVQPTKPIVRGIQEIKHEPNLSLDKQQSLAVAYCHVVILDMEGEGNLSSGSTAYISPGSVMFLLRIPADS